MTNLVVETTHGKVRGELHDDVAMWKGIPYAAPPLGALRFRPPQPPAPWPGERDATRFGTVATQSRDPRIAIMSGIAEKVVSGEDCLMLNVFAPRNAAEMARVLAPTGRLLVVTPNQQHLAELVDVLGLVSVDEEKERRLQASLAGEFDQVGTEVVEETMRLDKTAVEQLVLMTPSARHVNYRELLQQIAVLPERTLVTLSVTLSTWQPHAPR